MWHRLILSIAVCAIATPSLADSRYYCAADDANLKVSIDTGFSDAPGHRLNHFRGALIGKSTQIPADFARLMLDSSQLTQSWAYQGDLRLAVVTENGNGDKASSAELVIVATGKATSATLPGSYLLTFTASSGQPLQLSGKLTCGVK